MKDIKNECRRKEDVVVEVKKVKIDEGKMSSWED
jgi:hypothetical protein